MFTRLIEQTEGIGMKIVKLSKGQYVVSTPKYPVPLRVYRDYYGLWRVSQDNAPDYAGPYKTAKQAIIELTERFAECG
jgi:hypothetical protein